MSIAVDLVFVLLKSLFHCCFSFTDGDPDWQRHGIWDFVAFSCKHLHTLYMKDLRIRFPFSPSFRDAFEAVETDFLRGWKHRASAEAQPVKSIKAAGF